MKNFSVPAEVLQKHAYKDSVRNLNAEFQRMGGRVTSKSLKGGTKIQLSHPDDDYLETFRLKLLAEIDLLSEEDEEIIAKMKGDAGKEGDDGAAAGEDDVPRDRGDLGPVKEVIEGALEAGVVDDGQIIKFAYQTEVDPELIDRLREELMTNRCTNREYCPHKRKRIKFEDTMKGCLTAKEGCGYLVSDYQEFFRKWLDNVHSMFSEFDDKSVRVTGKISHYRYFKRSDGQNMLRILLFDTFVRDLEWDEEREDKETRKIWVKVSEEVFDRFDAEEEYHLGDIITITGKLQWMKNQGEYMVLKVGSMERRERGEGRRMEKIVGHLIGPNWKPREEVETEGGKREAAKAAPGPSAARAGGSRGYKTPGKGKTAKDATEDGEGGEGDGGAPGSEDGVDGAGGGRGEDEEANSEGAGEEDGRVGDAADGDAADGDAADGDAADDDAADGDAAEGDATDGDGDGTAEEGGGKGNEKGKIKGKGRKKDFTAGVSLFD